MAEIARLFRFDDQPPLIQLVISFFVVVVIGTLLFWLFIFIGSLLFGVAAGTVVQIPENDPDESGRLMLKYIQFSQQIGLFLIPSLLISYFIGKERESFLKLSGTPGALNLLFVFLLALLLIPLMNFTGNLNSRMVLPENLSAIQDWMRTKEELASRLTGLLINSSAPLTLTLNILILALVPAFSEELLFRGILQQIMNRILRSSHAGIWVTAIIFSSIHLQFFGFLPRLILGLVFGYLFYWTGNLWYSIAAHFFNNLIPVILAFFSGWKSINMPVYPESRIISGFPLVALIFSGLILFYFWRESRSRSGVEPERTSGGKSRGV